MQVTFDLPNATPVASLDSLAIEAAKYQGVLVAIGDTPVTHRMPSREMDHRKAISEPACLKAWAAERTQA